MLCGELTPTSCNTFSKHFSSSLTWNHGTCIEDDHIQFDLCHLHTLLVKLNSRSTRSYMLNIFSAQASPAQQVYGKNHEPPESHQQLMKITSPQ